MLFLGFFREMQYFNSKSISLIGDLKISLDIGSNLHILILFNNLADFWEKT